MTALEELLEDATAGDPITGLKWTHRSLRSLSNALRRRGIKLAGDTIARLMRQRDFSLRTNRKRLAGTHDPQRERQFRSLTRMRRLYLARGLPVISVDTKKKEWVGNFKNPGRCWRRQARDVLDHDFRFIRRKRAPPDKTWNSAHPINSYLLSWIARIFSLKNSLSRNP